MISNIFRLQFTLRATDEHKEEAQFMMKDNTDTKLAIVPYYLWKKIVKNIPPIMSSLNIFVGILIQMR